MVAWGIWQISDGTIPQAESATWEIEPETTASGALLIFLLAARFVRYHYRADRYRGHRERSSGLKKPKSKNAATTLLLPA